jgi:hypothetical protein
MISTYKDPSKAKVITLLDEAIADDPQGRTGKGIIFKAISQVRNVISINGKAFDPGSAFALQEVRPDTELIVFQDVKKSFPFEWLYSSVTDGFSVNPKGKSSFFLPFETSPKFGITSNYMIQGEGSSHVDRIQEVELSPYYSDTFKPVDEFKRTFFGPEWTKEDWNSFYQLMFSCAKDYLKYGLKQVQSVNIKENKLRQFTAPEFVEWANYVLTPKYSDDKPDGDRGRYNKKYLLYGGPNLPFKALVEMYPDFKKVTQRTFTKWMRTYAGYKGWSWDDNPSNGERYITLYAHYERAAEQEPAGMVVEAEEDNKDKPAEVPASSPVDITSGSATDSEEDCPF